MKKILTLTLVCLFVLGFSATAKAVVLAPGDLPALSTGAAPSGTLSEVAKRLAIPFTGIDGSSNTWFTGNLDAYVYSNADLGGTLLFTYQFTLDPSPSGDTRPDSIDIASNTDFSGFSTDIDVKGQVGTWGMKRTTGAVKFTHTTNGVPEGSTSPLFWAQTNALYYTDGTTQLQGAGNCGIITFAPTTPEPASMTLLGIGLMGLCGSALRKRRMKKRFQA